MINIFGIVALFALEANAKNCLLINDQISSKERKRTPISIKWLIWRNIEIQPNTEGKCRFHERKQLFNCIILYLKHQIYVFSPLIIKAHLFNLFNTIYIHFVYTYVMKLHFKWVFSSLFYFLTRCSLSDTIHSNLLTFIELYFNWNRVMWYQQAHYYFVVSTIEWFAINFYCGCAKKA